MDRIEAESIRTMYAQMRATAFATVIVTTYMVGVSLAFTPWPIVLGWAVLPLALMAWREVSFRAFRDQAPADANMRPWANAFVAQQALVGAVWGLTMVLFAHPVQPLSIALTLCCLYSIGAGSVTSLAYYPRAKCCADRDIVRHDLCAPADRRRAWLYPARQRHCAVRGDDDRLLPQPVASGQSIAANPL